MPSPRTNKPATQLRQILALLSVAVENLASEWESSPSQDTSSTMSHAECDAVKTIIASLGSLESLVLDPHTRLLNLSMSYLVSRALHIAAEHEIAELLSQDTNDGVSAAHLARVTGIEEGKLCRVMRTLTSHHIFQEIKEGWFANNHISQALVSDAAFQANIIMKGQLQYRVSDFLPQALANPAIRDSYDPRKTAFQQAVGTKLSLFDWMNEMVPKFDANRWPWSLRRHTCEEDGAPLSPRDSGQKMVPRPEKQLFNLAISGQGRSTEQYCVLDFPWKDLEDGATVVDVGGGIGSFCMQLHAHHPSLRLVIQDREHVIQQAIAVWETKHLSAIAESKVKLAAHDFFKKNPVVGAEIYWLRYIIHDWADNEAIAILSRVAESMNSNSRVLIAEILMYTTIPSPKLKSAPKPLLANYGQAMSPAHMMDLNMMMMTNGRERTPAEFERIVQEAGLVLDKIWECRGPLSIIECRLA
ncbi:uncharacterized protein Z519_01470 [Cladophialophora bantiana CBS 173.52]|uniref:O-methyltransferase domain-containing protein n=1 Tax=Cladophialophora bantiana (strain ATCC 10958 / CBS 173.52 / CDC B-1940 / NIH 8579) TaxID=1442370 RepID=A0A0D2F6X9_CLAB1|nr:uncharacterized protein Z519_01470 [Cladophialophora bantiana CBS 173.52]KIW97886.1 hypothetical protein Z519_01470 [Cladophialophora bantiana CBS 173.52]